MSKFYLTSKLFLL